MKVRTPLNAHIQSRLALSLLAAFLIAAPACSDNDDNGSTDPDTGMTDAVSDTVDDASTDTDAADSGTATASVQFIYEVAEPAASEVDLFVDDELVADNIQFRTATSFMEIRANQQISIEVGTKESATAGGDDTTLDPGEATFGDPITTTLEADSTNQIMVHGVANAQDYSVGDLDVQRDISLAIAVNDDARQEADNVEGITEVNAFHATIDAPAVDLLADNSDSPFLEGLDYGGFSGEYVNFEEGRHVLSMTPVDDNSDILKTFQTEQFETANVMTIVASGFRSPDNADNENPNFGLVGYGTEDGDGDGFIQGQTLTEAARVQFVHASPDPDATTIDVFFDEERRLNEFSFGEATSFSTIPADIPYEIAVTDPAAADPENPLVPTQTTTFEPGSVQVVVAGGVIDPGEWEGDFERLGLDLYGGNALNVVPDSSSGSARAAVQIFHGSTDAGTIRAEVSVPDNDEPRRFPALEFTEFLSDVRGSGQPVILDATDRTITFRNDAGTAIGSSYSLPLSSDQYSGLNTTLIATGVLTSEGDPADAEPFQIFVVTETGETFEPVPAN